MAGLALLAAPRTRRRVGQVGGSLLVLCLLVPLSARAQAIEDPASPAIDSKEAAEVGATVAITPAEVQAVQKERLHQALFSIYVAGGGSLYNGAVAGMVGVRWSRSSRALPSRFPSSRTTVGLEASFQSFRTPPAEREPASVWRRCAFAPAWILRVGWRGCCTGALPCEPPTASLANW